MYNKDIKERYIKEKESNTCLPNNYLQRWFCQIMSFEENLDKDLYSFTVYEILDMYKTLNLTSFETLVVLNSHLSLYTQWALQQNLVPDCQNHFDEITQEALMKCLNTVIFNKSIITKKDLYYNIDQLVNPSDAFIMIALFEGIKGKEYCEIVNLRLKDFDFEKKTVNLYTGRTLSVSDKLLEIARNSAITQEYVTMTKGDSPAKTIPFWEDEPIDLIVKNYPNCSDDTTDFYKGRRVYHKLMRGLKSLNLDKYISATSIVVSGKIDFVKERAKQLEITPYEYLYSKHVKELMDKYDFNFNIIFYKKYKEFLEN